MRYSWNSGTIGIVRPSESLDTPVTFTKCELSKIRAMMSSDTLLGCPRCGEMLNDVSLIAGGGGREQVFAVNCHRCNRLGFLHDE